ncbi:CHAT domain-containing protein [Streptomyces sp. HUAS TT20]|uniref:CHAT domain-containing protein n=1 Tax=Streptomyces sp. HUAS TT20 TaxID=3447509 RepID=UPI0021DB4CE7|nr:CHAT domain-containing protein [Streptomyces sp. HUAS 15-9]UXY27235.1 CHAT domain-containing protein [Streptomyces sp. HUAS 15-9]
MFRSRRPHRHEAARAEAATGLYERFVNTKPTVLQTLEDAAMEAIVTGVCYRVTPRTSLGVSLPTPDPDPDAGRNGLLAEAIALLDPVVERDVQQPGTLALMARCLKALHRETGDVAPLRRAVALWERAATADPASAAVRHDLGAALVDLAVYEGGAAHVAEAARHAHEATRLCTATDRRKATYLCGFSRALCALFERTGKDDVRKLAVSEAASAATLNGEPVPAECGYALGAALLTSYEATGSLLEIEYAVSTLRQVVDLEPLPEYLLALARALCLMYPTCRDERILREAVQTSRRALAAALPSDPTRYRYLQQAAHARLLSHAAHGGRGVVDVAVPFQRLAIGSMPEDHPHRVDAIGVLADIWLAQYEKTKETADLDGAYEATLVAKRLSKEHPDHHRHLARYGRGARLAVETTKDAAYLRLGISATTEALNTDGLPKDLEASYLLQTATLLIDYTDLHPDDELRQAARNMLAECTRIDDQEPHVLAEAAGRWADLAIAAESWLEAGTAHFGALSAMWRMTGMEVSRESQESTLHRFSGMASSGAACLVQAGKPMHALTVLELGRGVMMTRDLNFYDEIRALRRSAPELSHRLSEQLKKRDEAAAMLGSRLILATEGLPGDGRIGDLRRVAARNLKMLAAEVRKVPGHERFMEPPSDEELLAASGQGPIVVVNLSPLRSDALVVRPTGVTVVPLPAITPEAVATLVDTFQAAVAKADAAANDTMLDGLAWLWDNLAEPVLSVAAPGKRRVGPLPRLWWCPTGPLSHLPLHAAGHHRAGDGRTVAERVISSYIPTISALRRVRARQTDPSAADRGLLAVAVSRTESGEQPLPGARSEAAEIAKVHPSTRILADAAATNARLLRELPGYGRVHFICHALTDTRSPSLSRLVLHGADDVLTVDDIARLDLSSGKLAYLSVCEAARPGAKITDEAVHIAGAFLIAGYPDVVGTLWPMPDAAGRRLARRFYRQISDGSGPAHALHHTVTQAYRRAPASPVLWANLVHIGR